MTKIYYLYTKNTNDDNIETYTYETTNPNEIRFLDEFLTAIFEEPHLYQIATENRSVHLTPDHIQAINLIIQDIQSTYGPEITLQTGLDPDDLQPVSTKTPINELRMTVQEIFDFAGELFGFYFCDEEEKPMIYDTTILHN